VLEDVQVVEQELQAYGHGLIERPRIPVLNKIELLEAEALEERRAALEGHCGEPVLAVSAATSANLNQLLAVVWEKLGLVNRGAVDHGAEAGTTLVG
jgi:GTP-binding protein